MKRILLMMMSLILCQLGKAQVADSLIGLKQDTLTSEEPKQKLASYLSREWELERETKRGTFKLYSYRANFIMPLRWTDKFNRQPFNENPDRGQPEYKNYQNIEAKFQVSLKAKILQDAFFGYGDVWVGYTQEAYWQVYNGGLSRPFREMNYEPEVMVVMPLNIGIKDFRWRMMSVSLNHQSNGKEQLLSRSWNRIIFTSFFEYKNWVFEAQYHWRLKEKPEEDENPKIDSYIGRLRLNLAYNAGGNHTFVLNARTNLNFDHRNRTNLQLSYVFPISGYLKGLFQVSHGYGDSLIEYNHKQTNLGLGFLLLEM